MGWTRERGDRGMVGGKKKMKGRDRTKEENKSWRNYTNMRSVVSRRSANSGLVRTDLLTKSVRLLGR